MAWLLLFLAGLLEVLWAFALKQSDGFTNVGPTVTTVVAGILSLGLLSVSMRTLPLGTAYMVWTGVGAIGAFAVGIAVLGEEVSAGRVAAAALIFSGIVLMKLSHPG